MYDIKYKVGEKVKLPSVHKEIEGVIVSIYITNKGIEYKTRYFWKGTPQEVYFFDWEIEKLGRSK